MKTNTDQGWNPCKHVILVQITLFCMHKTTDHVWDPQRFVILVLKALFCMHKTTGEGWNQYSLFNLVLSTQLCISKPQMRSGTHRDLKFWYRMCSFACKNHTLVLEPIPTGYSDANHAVLHAQNDRSCLGPIGICYSGPEVGVLQVKITDEGWDP